MCYQHSVLRASHSSNTLQHDGMTGRDTCALSIVDSTSKRLHHTAPKNLRGTGTLEKNTVTDQMITTSTAYSRRYQTKTDRSQQNW